MGDEILQVLIIIALLYLLFRQNGNGFTNNEIICGGVDKTECTISGKGTCEWDKNGNNGDGECVYINKCKGDNMSPDKTAHIVDCAYAWDQKNIMRKINDNYNRCQWRGPPMNLAYSQIEGPYNSNYQCIWDNKSESCVNDKNQCSPPI